MLSMKVAIQCRDMRTLATGSFGFLEEKKDFTGRKGFYSLTPVFPDLAQLFRYMNENNIQEIK